MRRGIIAVSLALLLFSLIGSMERTLAQAEKAYDWKDAADESYWYALYNMQSLITSGLGISFSDQDRRAMLARLSREAGFVETTIENLLLKEALIAVPYVSGDPIYERFEGWQWAADRMDRTITTEAIAWMAIAASAQAKQLEHLYQKGIAQSEETRLWAMLSGQVAAQAAQFAQMQLRDPQTGLYHRAWKENVGASDPALRPLDQLAMLWVWSEMSSLAEGFSFYRAEISSFEAKLRATQLFRAIFAYGGSHPDWLTLSLHDTGLMIETLAAYASILSDASLLNEVIGLIDDHSRRVREQLAQTTDVPLAHRAEAVRALIAAQHLTGDQSLRESALKIWDSMQSLWDDTAGVYSTQPARPQSPSQAPYDYTAPEIGAIVGAFGAIIYGAGKEEFQTQYARFFRSAIKISGLMLAEREEAGGDVDGDEVPSPKKAGGAFGRAPVFVSSVQYDPGDRRWHVMNERFHTAGALYLAARLMWISQREGEPFLGPPRFGLPDNQLAQFIRLQRELAQLQSESRKLEGLKELLTGLEARVEELKKQLEELRKQPTTPSDLAQELERLKSEIRDVKQLTGELSLLEQRLDKLESKILEPAPTRATFTVPDALTVVLILLVVLMGFVAYQRLLQRTI